MVTAKYMIATVQTFSSKAVKHCCKLQAKRLKRKLVSPKSGNVGHVTCQQPPLTIATWKPGKRQRKVYGAETN